MTEQAYNPSATLDLYADGPVQLEAVLILEMQASHVVGLINDIQTNPMPVSSPGTGTRSPGSMFTSAMARR